MKVSIVTPVLNGARFLPNLLDCIQRQSLENWEHIVVDAGSTDASQEIVQKQAELDPRLKLVVVPGLALYPSIFHGFDQATGDIMTWIANDDLYTEWAFASVVDCIERTDANWVTGFPGAWDASGRLRYVRPYGRYPQSWIRKGWFHAGLLGHLQQESMFFSRSLLNKLSHDARSEIESMKLAGDFLLWRHFAEHSPLRVLPTVLGGFRFHGENLSVGGAEAYAEEVRTTGAPFPHPRVQKPLEGMFRKWSAIGALKIMKEADGCLFQSVTTGPVS